MGRHNQAICARIQVLEPKSSEFDDNGLILLDTGSDFQVRTTRKIEQLIEFDKINVDQPLGFSIPRTRKNDSELGWYVNPSLNNPTFDPIKVQVIVGGYVLQHTLLHVVNCSERTQTYECELRADESHWVIFAKRLKLKDITDWPEFQMTIDNVKDTWAETKYNDGDLGVQFPLAYYGAWYETGNVKLIDLRPYVYRLALLQRAFSQIGWQFKCPYLETNWGRQLIDYLIDPLQNQDEKENKKNSISASYEIMQEGLYNGKVYLDKIDYDDKNTYSGGEFRSEGVFNIKIDLLIAYGGIDPGLTGGRYELSLIKRSQGVESIVQNVGTTIFPNSEDAQYLTIDLTGVPLSITDSLYVTALLDENPLVIWNVYLKISPANSILFRDGLKFRYPSVINRTLTLYEYLKGTVHEISGIFETDYAARKVTLWTPFPANVFGQSIDGYFRENVVHNLIPDQENESCISESLESTQKRYLRLQYASSRDARIRGLNFPEDNPPFSRTYDINPNLNPEIEESANPLYEPTINDDVLSLFNFASPIDPAVLRTYKISLPFLVDNDSGKLSFNVGYRTLHYEGLVSLQTPEGLNITHWRFENELLTTFPYAFQYTKFKKGDGSPFTKFQMYGDDDRDLFNLFHRRYLLESKSNFKCEILHYSKSSEHFGRSFRDYYRFLYKGQEVQGRLIESRDHDGCANTTTPLILVPKNMRDDIFVLEERESDKDCSSQSASIVVTKSGNNYTFSADTSGITKTIVSTVIRWKYVDSSTWTIGTTLNNPIGKFIVQLQIELEDCNDITDSILVDPCNDNKPALLFSYRYDELNNQHCLTVTIGGLLNDEVDYDNSSFTATIYEGLSTDTEAYTIGSELCVPGDKTKICISYNIEFIGNPCDPSTGEVCFDLESIPQNCNFNNPVVLGEHVGNGAFRLKLGGSWISKFQSFELQYRLVGDDDKKWVNWDGHEPLFFGTFEARLVMWFCDQCPPICTDPVVFTDPLTSPTMSMTSIHDNQVNFIFDFDSLPDFEKENARKYYEEKAPYKLMALTNQYKIAYYIDANGHKSYHKYCCGEHSKHIMEWYKTFIV